MIEWTVRAILGAVLAVVVAGVLVACCAPVHADTLPVPLPAPAPQKAGELVPLVKWHRAQQATARVDAGTSRGSGTFAGDRDAGGRWWLATAYHVTRGAKARAALKDGRVLDLEPVACDSPNDVCWMRTVRGDLAVPVPSVPLGAPPVPGARVWVCGYALGMAAEVREGVVTDGPFFDRLNFRIRSGPGDSGAALLDDDGALVGVVTGGLAHLSPGGVGPVLSPRTRDVRRIGPLPLLARLRQRQSPGR